MSDKFVVPWELFAGTTRFGFIVRQQCFKTRNDPGLVYLVFYPLPKGARSYSFCSHHLPLSSLSLALISPMCNESYLKPTKTSSTPLSQLQGQDPQKESMRRWGPARPGRPPDPPRARSGPDPHPLVPFSHSAPSRRVSIS